VESDKPHGHYPRVTH